MVSYYFPEAWCKVFSPRSSVSRISTYVHFHSLLDPPRVRISGDTTVNEGARISISCTIRGTPRPIANWYKDGKLLYVSNSRGTITRTLVTIIKAEPSDSGTYECRAVHDSGRDRDSMTLTVLQRKYCPVFLFLNIFFKPKLPLNHLLVY